MKSDNPKYYDSAATTSVDPRVLEKMMPYFIEIFGNASSNHSFGKQAKRAIDDARKHVAAIINSDPNEIYFTSGATESINWALKGYLEENPDKGNHIITVKTEHKAVLNTCEYLEKKGFEVTYLDVDHNGLIDLDQLRSEIRETTALISVMYVNNEIGIIQDIAKIGEIAQEKNVVFFCDATQAIGKLHVDVFKDKIDMLCLSGHKFNGPKGIGSLFIKQGINLTPLIHGGGQEKGFRAGTYNTPLIVGFGEACRIALDEFEINSNNFSEKRAEIENHFVTNNLGYLNFQNQQFAPHIISITLIDQDAEDFLITHQNELIASIGSACNSSIIEMNHVLVSLGIENAQKIIRISI